MEETVEVVESDDESAPHRSKVVGIKGDLETDAKLHMNTAG